MAAPHSNMDSMDDMFAGDGGFDFGASLDFLNRWNSDQQQPALPATASLAPVTWHVQPALGQAMYSQPIPGTVFTLFNSLPLEIRRMILKYAFKNPDLLRLRQDGSFSVSTSADGLFCLNQATRDIQTGLIYRVNVFTCPYSHSIPDLLRFSAEVTTNVHHITIPFNILAQRRVVELRRLPNLKTVRIEGFDSYNYLEFRTPIGTLNTIQHLQKIETAVRTVLRKPAVRGAYAHPRFDATKREVKELMNVKQVEVTCVAEYNVNGPSRRLLDFETVFKIKLVDSADGYELEVLSDEMV